ncbi:MAG: ATP-binding protein [Oscillospiraceae bacterium]|nr:ATP-binding protein [Oscillospiraceae bacterium]
MIQKLFRQMSTAQIISAMTTTLCLLIDSIVIGRLVGVDAMSAYGIASPLLIIFAALGTMMVNGVQVQLGKAIGRGDTNGANACYSTSILQSLGLGAVWILLVYAAGNPLCTLLGAGTPSADNVVFQLTGDYLRGFVLGAPFFFLSQIMSAYLQAAGKRKLLLISVIAMTVTDVVFDLLSVFVFHSGMFGIGLASGMSYLAAFAVGLGYFLKKNCLFRFRFHSFQPQSAVGILRAGSPVLLNQVFFTVRTLVFNLLLLDLGGNLAVAAFAVFTTLCNLMYSIGVGTGSVALMLSSIFYNEEDRTSLRSLVRAMVPHTTMLIAAAVLVGELAAPWLIRLFLGADPEMLAIAVPGLRLVLIWLIPNVLCGLFKNYFQGIRRTWITNLVAFLQAIGLMLPSVWLFSRLFGLTGFWIGSVVGQFLTLLVIAILVWVKCGRMSFSAEAFSYLSPDFGAQPENCRDLTILDVETAVLASQTLCDFCREKGVDAKTAMLIGLCVEEMTVNIIEHGFTKDKLSHNVDVRLVIGEDKRIIRIRDNCVNFDPTNYLELHQSSDPAAHIGLRMVMAMVKEAIYVNTLGLNNLTLIL